MTEIRSTLLPAGHYPYIDGLRALAVLAVLVFHLHPAWLPGGFVGVDVFFVISGFVVSLSVSHYQGGFWRFICNFYARRVRRILPALVVCLVLTSLFSVLGLFNFILASSGGVFVSPSTDFNPYTHTWSLGVEEQFYLIFPFLLLAWCMGEQWRRRSLQLFAGGLIISLLVAAWQSTYSPLQAYFLSPARFWELAAGVLLQQAGIARLSPLLRCNWQRNLLAVLSLILLGGAFAFSSRQGFPVPGALPAVLGALGLILSLHHHPQVPLHAWLGSRPLLLTGRMSYSLYLWHWPVFVLFRWTVGLEAFWSALLAVLLAFTLAAVSWRWVETPMRHLRPGRPLTQTLLISAGLLLVAGGWWASATLYTHQQDLSLSVLSQHREEWYPYGWATNPDYPGCVADPEHHVQADFLQIVFRARGCQPSQPVAPASIYAIGDSHTMAYTGLFRQYAIAHGVTIHTYTRDGCSFASFQPGRDSDQPRCRAFARAALADIRSRIKKGDVLFLAALRLPRFSDQWAAFPEGWPRSQMFGEGVMADRVRAEQQIVDDLRGFVAQGVHVIFEGPKPLFRAPPFRCADWFDRHNPICLGGLDMSRAELDEYRQPVLQSFAYVQRQLPQIEIWDPFPLLCPESTCRALRDGHPLFMDGDHLSGYGNLQLLPAFTRFMESRLGH